MPKYLLCFIITYDSGIISKLLSTIMPIFFLPIFDCCTDFDLSLIDLDNAMDHKQTGKKILVVYIWILSTLQGRPERAFGLSTLQGRGIFGLFN